ncbi:MAG: hypothetical protein LBR21_05455 [Propionibacteriaceae bacterium]|jgi:hypothetical protein|nr:hypothetical protein [Propionibacteriaceae bacterium]
MRFRVSLAAVLAALLCAGSLTAHADPSDEPPPVPGVTLPNAAPAITGTPVAGTAITVAAGPYADGTSLTYLWYHETDVRPFYTATDPNYTVREADIGTKLYAIVIVSQPGLASAHQKTGLTASVLGQVVGQTPKIKGTVKIGKTLKAAIGVWTPGAKLKYQWYVGGKAVKNATKKTFKIPASAAGKRIYFTVSGTLSGYQPLTKTSKKTKAVPKPPKKVKKKATTKKTYVPPSQPWSPTNRGVV